MINVTKTIPRVLLLGHFVPDIIPNDLTLSSLQAPADYYA